MKGNQGVTPKGVGLPPASRAESVSPVSGETGIPNADLCVTCGNPKSRHYAGLHCPVYATYRPLSDVLKAAGIILNPA